MTSRAMGWTTETTGGGGGALSACFPHPVAIKSIASKAIAISRVFTVSCRPIQDGAFIPFLYLASRQGSSPDFDHSDVLRFISHRAPRGLPVARLVQRGCPSG